jgi:hypothetical protein
VFDRIRLVAVVVTTAITLVVPAAAGATGNERPLAGIAQNGTSRDPSPAETQAPDAGASVPATGRQSADDPALEPDPAQPDFSLIALPTNLPLPKFKGAFRVTHRFTRPLGQGSFGNSLSDLFGLDSGARIGLEFRFGLWRDVQAGIYRTSDKTIQFYGQYQAARQGDRIPVGLAAFLGVEGTNNFKDRRSPTLGAIISRTVGSRAAVYLEPLWVHNSDPLPPVEGDASDTLMVGLGARVRIRPTAYVVAEMTPRAAGFGPDHAHAAFAVEKQVGGHVFQLNVSNGFGTTPGQLALGVPRRADWYVGFNISRKFF